MEISSIIWLIYIAIMFPASIAIALSIAILDKEVTSFSIVGGIVASFVWPLFVLGGLVYYLTTLIYKRIIEKHKEVY